MDRYIQKASVCAEVDQGESSRAEWLLGGAERYAHPDGSHLKWNRHSKSSVEVEA